MYDFDDYHEADDVDMDAVGDFDNHGYDISICDINYGQSLPISICSMIHGMVCHLLILPHGILFLMSSKVTILKLVCTSTKYDHPSSCSGPSKNTPIPPPLTLFI